MATFAHDVHRLVGLSLMSTLGISFVDGESGEPEISEDDAERIAAAVIALDAAYPYTGPGGIPSIPVPVHPIEVRDVLVPGENNHFQVNEDSIVPDIWGGNQWLSAVLVPGQGEWSVFGGHVVFTAKRTANVNQAVAPLRYRYKVGADFIEGTIVAGWAGAPAA